MKIILRFRPADNDILKRANKTFKIHLKILMKIKTIRKVDDVMIKFNKFYVFDKTFLT